MVRSVIVRILVTGAAGFIGSTLSEQLIERGDEVIGVDCFDETLYPSEMKHANLVALRESPRFRLVEGDVVDEGLMRRLVGDVDAIVHLAALAGVRNSLAHPLRYHRTNSEGTLVILEAARLAGVEHVVNISTSSVYDPLPTDVVRNGSVSRALVETDSALRPLSPYGATKRAAELYCSTYSDVYGLRTTSLRLFSVYGPRQRPDMAIHKFARLMLEGRPIPVYGDGTSQRDFTYVGDVVDGIVAALDRQDEPLARVYNLGAGRATSLSRMIGMLESSLGVRAIRDYRPPQPGDAFVTLADVSLARRELGYEPAVMLEEGIEAFTRWFIERQPADIRKAVS